MLKWARVVGLSALAATVAADVSAQPRETAIGVTGAAATEARGFPPLSPSRVLRAGTDVVANERVTTSTDGRAQMVFLDGSALTIGPDAEVVLDRFVYDPDGGGELAMSATKGVLRLVGGKISKTNPVRITVPGGTIGIRGGVGLIDLRILGEATAICLFCVGLEVSNDNGTQTILRPGFAVTLRPGQPPSTPVPVRQALLAQLLGLLEGVRGDAAGAPEMPSEQRVRVSSAEAAVAAIPLGGSLAPPAPVDTRELLREAQQNDIRPDSESSSSSSSSAPIGATGLVGRFKGSIGGPSSGSADSGTTGNVAFSDGAISGGDFTATPGGGMFRAPASSGSFSFTSSGTTSPLGPVSGTGMFDASANFLFLSGRLENTPFERFFLFGGAPTPAAAIPSSGITAFSLGQDPIMQTNLPFLSAAVGGSLPGTVSPAFILWNGSVPGGQRSFGQSSFGLSDPTGTHTSALATLVGQVPGGGAPFVQGALRGSFRSSASAVPTFVTGPVASADGGDGSDFFGQNAPSYLVLESAAVDANDVTGARGIIPRPTPTTFGTTYFPNNLASSIALPHGVGAARTAETQNGWLAGAGYLFSTGGTLTQVAQLFNSSSGPNNVTLTRDPATNQALATFGIQVPVGTNVTLKLGAQTASDLGRSAFIDNARILMIEAANPGFDQGSLQFAAAPAYMVTNDLVAASALLPSGVTPCTCDFMTWGLWGADLVRQNGQVTRIHLAQFVTGRVTSAAELAGLTSVGMATFNGHVIGTALVGAGAIPGAVYETGGRFTMSWNFASPGGAISITQFDPRQFGPGGATINFNGVGPTGGNQFVQFAGGATGSPAGFSGSSIIGNFNNGTVLAQGVSGRVDINNNTGMNYRYFGVFLGQR
jgi:trimeric autotransporter adhesin